MTDLAIVDDGFEEDLGPRSAAEEFAGEYMEEAAEGFIEDKPINLNGTSAAAVLAAIPYVLAKKMASFGPFAALGADPFFGAKLLARGMFTALAALARNSKVPRPLFNLLRAFGPVGRGVISGSLDRGRRLVNKYLTAWSKMADPEAGMGPALGVAEGIVEFNWEKISGKASGSPSLPASTSASDSYNGRMEGMGDMKETLNERLRRLEATEATRVGDIRTSIMAFSGSFRSHWQAINEASERLLVDPDVIIRAAEAADDGELVDPDGGTSFVTNRVFALKRLATNCKKLVAKARDEDGTGPKDKSKAEEHTGLGPKKIKLGSFGEIDNPTWAKPAEEANPVTDPSRQLRNRNIGSWKDRMGPAPLALAPGAAPPRIGTRITSVLNLRGRAASLWARRRSLGAIIATPFLWGWRKYKGWQAARNAPANPPSPPTTIPPPPPTP